MTQSPFATASRLDNAPEQKRVNYRAVLAGQERALRLVQDGAELGQVFTELVRTLEAAFENSVVGSLMVVDTGGNCLRNGAAPSLPENYRRLIDGLVLGPYGTCCAAAHGNRVVVTRDFDSDPGWIDLKTHPLALGLRSAWSFPIQARDGKVLGTMGTYFRECREPTDLERELVSLLARTAAVAIERAESTGRSRLK